ncbi:hypothetical protein R6Z07F_007988 [Ovis aries]
MSDPHFLMSGLVFTASYPSPCLQPCDCPSLSTPQPEHPSEALHLIFITFHYPGKKTMWIVEIFCEERKRQKALDPKLKENQRLEFQLWRKDQKNARSRGLSPFLCHLCV